MEPIFNEASKYLMNTYARQPLLIHKGRGTRVYDTHGKEYLDFVSGIAVNNLGHCHPLVTEAFQRQSQRLIHVSNLYYTEPQVRLARLLVENSFADKVFFCNSGTEAIEAAIKLARKFSHDKHGPDRHEIIAMEQSFHGRTMGSVSAGGQPKYHKGFEPMLPGFRHVPYNDLGAVSKAISDRTAAVLVEPIQGEAGIRIPDEDYLPGLRKLCDERGPLLILDEVQTGIGRTGKMFCYEHDGIEPDIMTLAKGMGNGLPIGALLAREEVAQSFSPGTHAATFGGNPLVCSAAITTLEVILKEGFVLENCRRMGDYLLQRLNELKQRHSCIASVRGKGLMVGMELTMEVKPIVQDCLEQGILINSPVEGVLRFVPALIIVKDEIDQLIERLDAILSKRAG